MSDNQLGESRPPLRPRQLPTASLTTSGRPGPPRRARHRARGSSPLPKGGAGILRGSAATGLQGYIPVHASAACHSRMSPGPKVQMDSIVAHSEDRVRHIVVAGEDPKVVDFVVKTLRADHHAVLHAYDALSAVRLALAMPCDLVISNTKVTGVDGVDLIVELRQRRPQLPLVYLANIGRSTPEIEAQLPPDVPILREPFTADELRAQVAALLDRDGKQTID